MVEKDDLDVFPPLYTGIERDDEVIPGATMTPRELKDLSKYWSEQDSMNKRIEGSVEQKIYGVKETILALLDQKRIVESLIQENASPDLLDELMIDIEQEIIRLEASLPALEKDLKYARVFSGVSDYAVGRIGLLASQVKKPAASSDIAA